MPDKNGMTEVSFKLNPSELADVEKYCERMGVKRASWAKALLVSHARRKENMNGAPPP